VQRDSCFCFSVRVYHCECEYQCGTVCVNEKEKGEVGGKVCLFTCVALIGFNRIYKYGG